MQSPCKTYNNCMSREKALVKNTLIYMVGNFTSRFLGFLLLPLYTYYLTTAQYGYFNKVLITITIIIPVITLQINDSMYRYLLDSSSEAYTRKIITGSLKVIFFGLMILSLLAAFVSLAGGLGPFQAVQGFIRFQKTDFLWLILLYISATVLSNTWQQISRGLKQNVIYTSAGVVFSVVSLVSTVLLLIVFRLGLQAVFYSNILSSLAVILYVESKLHVLKRIQRGHSETPIVKELVKYSVPLMPNALNWWIISSCSVYVISYWLGDEANGIFGVSGKFPGLLVAFNSVFYLAWQESAIDEYASKDKDEFYTRMFNIYLKFQFCTLLVILPMTRWGVLLLDREFYDAWRYIPFLYLGTLFSAFSAFYGTGYLSSKDTKGAFTTSIAGSAINIAASLLLIPLIGIFGAAIANMLAFGGMWLLRIFQTRKYFKIALEARSLALLLLLCGAYIALYYQGRLLVDMLLLAASIPLFYLFNRMLVHKALEYVRKLPAMIRGRMSGQGGAENQPGVQDAESGEPERICTGCGVCAAVCPVKAISCKPNAEGFREAAADENRCIDCGVCEKVCAKSNETGHAAGHGRLYAAYSRDPSVRAVCSSGGVAHELAQAFLQAGYAVCGARYDNTRHEVVHSIAKSLEELEPFKGSKYLQSHMAEALSSLSGDGRYVLFGTPCQIYGIRQHLRQKGQEDRFLLVDLHCHGVPSKLLWEKYRQHIDKKYRIGEWKKVTFRDKSTGWHSYSMRIDGERKTYKKNMQDDLFYIFFLSDVCLNKACHTCRFRGQAWSDLRLGDFWGERYKHDRQGVSRVTVLTEKGMEALEMVKDSLHLEEIDPKEAAALPQAHRLPVPPARETVMQLLRSDMSLYEIYKHSLRKRRWKYKASLMLRKLIPSGARTGLKRLLKRTAA